MNDGALEYIIADVTETQGWANFIGSLLRLWKGSFYWGDFVD